MDFECDHEKSEINCEKHGIDFEQATLLWKDEKHAILDLEYYAEERSALIAKIGNKHWTAIYTQRSDSIRIISVRRSRKKEIMIYEQEETTH